MYCHTIRILTLLFASAFAYQTARAEEWLKAKALKPGDTIALIAPSGVVADKGLILEYGKQLEAAGFRVLIPEDIDRKSSYLAGSDDQRADELNSAIRNPDVRAIMPVRGGYGLTRILDRIDYEHLRKDPKIITGYSDITALHLAIASQVRLITFHSPMPLSSLAKSKDSQFAYANGAFQRVLFAPESTHNLKGFRIPFPDKALPESLRKGKARGRLVGGNLSLVTALLGTPYSLDAKGCILFLEDVHEAPYRVDRMLSSLRLSGMLDNVAGVVLGDFSAKEEEKEEMARVLAEAFSSRSYPVLWKFPVGHIPNNSTLPHGAMAELDADSVSLQILESPTSKL